ncbi:hypothetical protein UJ101_00630 [Flavobacteriaceae bacterium UJ101]|nr:hypothetical protein UJ101_00630 [Flavobacteriaceae bacterium UJ101]
MKKVILILFLSLSISSCLDDDNPNYQFKLLTIDKAITPESFTYGKVDTITVHYTLPNSCHEYNDLYYKQQDTVRIVAIRAKENLGITCNQSTIKKQHSIPIRVSQKKTYLFKFWKGKDKDGKDTYEEVKVPVIVKDK